MFYAGRVQLVGLTGGIASGKSTIAARLAEFGAIIIDADQIARDVVEPGTPALLELVRRFGDDILRPDGSLDRAVLGSRVFGDPVALAALNGITHPAVFVESQKRISEARDVNPDGVVVYDVPLLAESGHGYPFDLVVVAQASEDIRHDRLVSLRGMNATEARARIAAQATDEQRRPLADVIIDTSGTIESTRHQTDALWQLLLSRSAGNSSLSAHSASDVGGSS